MKNKLKNNLIIFIVLVNVFSGFCEINSEENEIKHTSGKFKFDYLSFPMSAEAGIFSIHNDFSTFFKTGFNYTISDSFEVNYLIGADFNYKNYVIKTSVQYNLFDNAFDFTTFKNKTYSAHIDFSFPIDMGRISIPFAFGQKIFTCEDSSGSEKERSLYLNWNPSFDFLLFDYGFVKGDGTVSNSITYLYLDNFVFDELKIHLNSVFFTRYFDFAFGIKYFNSFEIYKKDKSFDINKRFDLFTKRIKLDSKALRYSDIFMIENENRFYFLRFFNSASNLFISTFENIGAGFSQNKADLLWSVGIGFGYNLFTTVPFTVQFGIDSDFSPILSVFVVSAF